MFGDDDDVHEIEEFLDKLRTEAEENGDERDGEGIGGAEGGKEGAGAHPALREEYFENDGVVPIFSQWHPGTCEWVLLPSSCCYFISVVLIIDTH